MNNWQELVPFYVAGLLSPREKTAFETFLAQSLECQQAVAEWQAIAHAVWDETDSRSHNLPSLSKAVLNQISTPPYITRNGHNTENLEATVPAYKPPRVEYADSPRDDSPPLKLKRRSAAPIFALSAAAAVMITTCAVILFLALRSPDGDPDHGSSSKSTPTVIHSPTADATLTTVPNISVCNLSSPAAVNIYAEPNANSTVEGVLQPGVYLQSLRKTADNWYNVSLGSSSGWVRGDEVQLTGQCDDLPVPTPTGVRSTPNFVPSPTMVPTEAPPDADYQLVLDRFSATTFNEIVSYPDGDTTDRIELELAGLTQEDNYRELQISVYCILGENLDTLRWYWGEDTSLTSSFQCDETGSLVLSASSNREILIVTIPEGSPRSVVSYTITITPTLLGGTPVATSTAASVPTAPQDSEPHPFELDPNSARQLSEKLSVPMPQGDSADNITLTLTNGIFGQRYEYSLLLVCSGPVPTDVRWLVGNSDTAYRCGDEVSEVFLSVADNQKLVSVILDEYSYANYIEYTLIAQPVPSEAVPTLEGSIAPSDGEPHDFIVSRAGSNRFTDLISYPDGDTLDRIHVTFADMQAGEIRQVEISLICTGSGLENVTWAILNSEKSNVCAGTLYATFTDQNNQISFDVTFSDQTSGTGLVSYTLEVRETP